MAGHEVELTPTEHELLRILSVNAGQVTTSDLLLRQFWVRREDANVQAVRNFVKTLRRKLGDYPASPSFIRNVMRRRLPHAEARRGVAVTATRDRQPARGVKMNPLPV